MALFKRDDSKVGEMRPEDEGKPGGILDALVRGDLEPPEEPAEPLTAALGAAGFTASDHVGCVDAQEFSEIVHTGLREWPERCKRGHPFKVWPGWTT